MNDLQRVEFGLLEEFDRVCRLVGVEYFLVCGSALGAVKYGGFIPWDDDIDVALYRSDYERFIQEAPAYLKDGVFLQNYRSDSKFPQIYSKLRDCGTTYIERSARKLPINHGVFIDVFPLDGYPKNPFAQKRVEFFKRLYQSILLSAYDVPRRGKSLLLAKVYGALGLTRNTAWIAERYECLIARYQIEGSELLCNHGNWQGTLEYAPRRQYGNGAKAHFEGMEVRVPELHHEYLSQKYGDYMADLPESQRVGHHYYEVLDCKNPFDIYIDGTEEGRRLP